MANCNHILKILLAASFFFLAHFIYSSENNYSYPNFDDNPYLQNKMKKQMRPFLLPLNHPCKPILDRIFNRSRAIENELAFAQSGFETLLTTHASYLTVARHPCIPGYLFKVYLDSELRLKNERAGWEWLVDRCKGAQNVRKLIKKKRIRHFIVPDKYIYPLPAEPSPVLLSGQPRQPILLLVTDMNLTSRLESVNAWKNKITKEHLDELYLILSHGYASAGLIDNIPYTESGKFACVDTEYVKRKINYRMARSFLSEEMKRYWDQLVYANKQKN